MTERSLQSMLRNLTEADPSVSDAELLRRFSANDGRAFAELVRRHGRLVWAVCRSQTRSEDEADDAFQATFLVLLKNAKAIREAGKLSSWLHGVAYKICAKSRQVAKRREAREQAAARRERNGSAIPDSAWDRALAAVHEEVAKLPETLRVPFVLCCLQGVGVTEAAEQLGWKLGTLSGRLTRAKDSVLARLDARGLSLAVVASVGLVTVPSVVIAKAQTLAQVGSIVPGSILQLSQGVIGMSLKTVKVLAAVILLAGGATVAVGTGYVARAQEGNRGFTQQQGYVMLASGPQDEIKRLESQLEKAKAEKEKKAEVDKANRERPNERLLEVINSVVKPEDPARFKGSKWEYHLVDIVSNGDKPAFEQFLAQWENAGWEFLGSTTGGPSGNKTQLLFRRAITRELDRRLVSGIARSAQELFVIPQLANPAVAEDPKAIEAEIAKLQEKLKEMKAKAEQPKSMNFDKASSPLEPATLATVLSQLAEKKYGKGKVNVSHVNGLVTVYGDKDVIDWACGVVTAMNGK